MALLIETAPRLPGSNSHRHGRPRADHPSRSLHLVPEGGVLMFPGVPSGVEPPAQLGPLMSPPSGSGVFGR
jgi:hypothetical protein